MEGRLAADKRRIAHGSAAEIDRWTGVLDGVGYRIEVLGNWNGMLVTYVRGFRGEGEVLTADSPPIRQYLVAKR